MKIIAATSHETILVEMSTREMRAITDYKWTADQSYPHSPEITLRSFRAGEEIALSEAFEHAGKLLETFRGIAPGLRQQAVRLSRLADEVQLHEPDHNLLPKGDA